MLLVRVAVGLVVQVLVFATLLFLPAATWHWTRAWVFLAVLTVASGAAVAVLFPKHRAVIEERMKPPVRRDQPLWDVLLSAALVASLLGAIAMIPVERFRLQLLTEAGPVVSAIGLAVFVAGLAIACLAAAHNPFAAAVVRHQKERRHTVASTGVYAVVRHPMYAGSLLWMLGMPLSLGSYAGMLFFLAPIAVLVLRITLEERFLKRTLDGYAAYTEKVRYRLVPYVF
jgi:protein-S-isoprenylcysteine O-methyltransferase Ste14